MCCMLCVVMGEKKPIEIWKTSITVHWNLIGWKLQASLTLKFWIFMKLCDLENAEKFLIHIGKCWRIFHAFLSEDGKAFSGAEFSDSILIKTCFSFHFEAFFSVVVSLLKHCAHKLPAEVKNPFILIHSRWIFSYVKTEKLDAERKRCGWKDMTETWNAKWGRKKDGKG